MPGYVGQSKVEVGEISLENAGNCWGSTVHKNGPQVVEFTGLKGRHVLMRGLEP